MVGRHASGEPAAGTLHEQLDSADAGGHPERKQKAVGLVHMNGRVYDPELGRFMSPDIAIQDITNLQALNSYTYVNNNPLRSISALRMPTRIRANRPLGLLPVGLTWPPGVSSDARTSIS